MRGGCGISADEPCGLFFPIEDANAPDTGEFNIMISQQEIPSSNAGETTLAFLDGGVRQAESPKKKKNFFFECTIQTQPDWQANRADDGRKEQIQGCML